MSFDERCFPLRWRAVIMAGGQRHWTGEWQRHLPVTGDWPPRPNLLDKEYLVEGRDGRWFRRMPDGSLQRKR